MHFAADAGVRRTDRIFTFKDKWSLRRHAERPPISTRPSWHFFLLTFLFSWVAWLPSGLGTYGILDSNGAFASLGETGKWLGGVGPSAIAIFLVAKDGGWRNVKELLGRAFRLRLGYWYIPTLLLVPLAVIIAHQLNVLMGGAWPNTALLSKPWLVPALFAVFFVMQVGEEYGWRGYALIQLQRRSSAFISSLIVGSCWAVWHVPMYFIDGFGLSESRAPFAQFAITLITISILITWMQNNSTGSLVPAFVCHALINLAGEVLPLYEFGDRVNGPGAWTFTNLILIGCVVAVLWIWGTRTMVRARAA